MHLKTFLLASVAGTVFLAGCTDTTSYNPDDPYQHTREGALTGALIGAGLGLATGDGGKDKLDRAVVGGALGALAGGVIGNNLDKQAAELQRDIHTRGVRIINEGDQLRVIMPEGILFPVDSARVQSGIMDDLYTVADSLNEYPDTRVEVVGHTDDTGSSSYNMDLSERRADAVAAVLRDGGVSRGRIVAYGRGEDEPIASNATASGRQQNRRVEILIIPRN